MKVSFPLKVRLLEYAICTILFISYTHHSRMEDLFPSGVITTTGCPITTGAQEVTTMDKLQLCFAGGGGGGGGGGVVGGSLTFRSHTVRGGAR